MKLLLIFLLNFVSLVACAGKSSEPNPKGMPVLPFEEEFAARKEASATAGDLYFLETQMNVKSPSPVAQKALAELKEALRSKVEAAGYKAAKEPKAAHLLLLAELNVEDHKEGSFRYRATVGSDPASRALVLIEGGTVLKLSAFAIQRSHGKRPVTVAQASTRGAQTSFAGAYAGKESISRIVNSFIIPKSGPAKDAELPGCYPSFGYRTMSAPVEPATLNDLNAAFEKKDFKFAPAQQFIVIKVVAGGPAQKAGLKIGDELLAIDSVPYEKFDTQAAGEEAALYESKQPLPIKFKRAGKILRGSILPKIICE